MDKIDSLVKKRNYSLDSLKVLAMILVVFIHVKFPGQFGLIVTDIARIAVPLFFMISGLYIDGTQVDICKKRCLKAVMLLGISVGIYLIYNIFVKGLSGFFSSITLPNLLKLIVFNKSIFAEHLWYLYAVLYCYVVVLFLAVIKKFDTASKILCYLLIVTYLIGEILPIALDRDNSVLIYRNAYLTGIPFMMIGYRIGKSKLCANGVIVIVLAVFGCALSVAERMLFFSGDLYIGTSICAIALFVYAVRHPGKDNVISKIGNKYSAFVYVVHPLVISLLGFIFSRLHVEENPFVQWVNPILVVVVSLSLAFLYEKIKTLLIKRGNYA